MTGAAWNNILFATQEELGREPVVALRGKRVVENKRIIFRIINACPLMNTDRKPTQVEYTNQAAIKRITDLDRLLLRLDSGYRIIGHYHPHPETNRTKVDCELGDIDQKDSAEWMKILGLRYYIIDIIGKLIKLKYDTPQKKNLEITPYDKGLKALFNFRPKEGVELYLRAFKTKLNKEKRPYIQKELQIDIIKAIINSREILTRDNNI